MVCSFSKRLSLLYASITISCEAEKNVTDNERTATLYRLISGLDCPNKNIDIISSACTNKSQPLLLPRGDITYRSKIGAHKNFKD